MTQSESLTSEKLQCGMMVTTIEVPEGLWMLEKGHVTWAWGSITEAAWRRGGMNCIVKDEQGTDGEGVEGEGF